MIFFLLQYSNTQTTKPEATCLEQREGGSSLNVGAFQKWTLAKDRIEEGGLAGDPGDISIDTLDQTLYS